MKRIVLLVALIVVLLGGLYFWQSTRKILSSQKDLLTSQVVQKGQNKPDYYAYQGEEGKSALDLLRNREKAVVEQDKSGLVTAINSRKADPSKHEFWAFYVNGKLASVGPAAYITHTNDKIVWQIQTY